MHWHCAHGLVFIGVVLLVSYEVSYSEGKTLKIFLKIFLCELFLKSLLIFFCNIVSVLFSFLAKRHMISQLPDQDWTYTTCIGRWSLTTEPPEVPQRETLNSQPCIQVGQTLWYLCGNSQARACVCLAALCQGVILKELWTKEIITVYSVQKA